MTRAPLSRAWDIGIAVGMLFLAGLLAMVKR